MTYRKSKFCKTRNWRYVRKYAAITLAIFSVESALAQSQGVTNELLYKACKSTQNSQEFGICIGFITGVIESSLVATNVAMIALGKEDSTSARKAAAASTRVFGCGHEHGFVAADTAKHYVTYYENREESVGIKTFRGDEPAIYALTYMMSKYYTCQKK